MIKINGIVLEFGFEPFVIGWIDKRFKQERFWNILKIPYSS